jgi:hypothetical protein
MNYVQPELTEGQYYSVNANKEKIVGNDDTDIIYMYCANKHGSGDNAGFRYKFVDDKGQTLGEARTASLTEWVKVASDYLLKPCEMMPVTPGQQKETQMSKIQTAAPVSSDAYNLFIHNGQTVEMTNKNKTLIITKGDIYGVRYSTSKKFIRLILLARGESVVYTLTAEAAAALGKKAKTID